MNPLDSETNSQGQDTICTFQSGNLFNFNTNSILNVDQLSLILTYAELNNKFNLLNFLKIRCEPFVIRKALEYFFIGWGLPSFYKTLDIQNIFQAYTDPFLDMIKQLPEANGGRPNITSQIDFEIGEKKMVFKANTGVLDIGLLRSIEALNGKDMTKDHATYMFQALIDSNLLAKDSANKNLAGNWLIIYFVFYFLNHAEKEI